MTREAIDAKYGAGQWLPMPRFEHVQRNGKQRPIDDAKRWGHNDATGYDETLDCCAAVQPAIQVAARVQQIRRSQMEQIAEQGICMDIGGEDTPDADRWIPSAPEEAAFNVVGVYDEDAGQHMYQGAWEDVSWKPAVVINSHRPQRLLTAIVRRCLRVCYLLLRRWYTAIPQIC